MREDELAMRVVEYFRATFDDVEIHLEKPYNYYGDRGAADVYVWMRTPEPVDYFIELRVDATIYHAIGANEILHRHRRMGCYLYKDDEHAIRTKLGREGLGVHALLLFTPTKRCVEHIREHATLYESIDPDAIVEGVETTRKTAFLMNLDRAPEGELGSLSLNGPLAFDSVVFRETVPSRSRLADALWGND